MAGFLTWQVCCRVESGDPAVLSPPLSQYSNEKCFILCLLLQLPFIHVFDIFTLSIYVQHLYLVSKGDPWT